MKNSGKRLFAKKLAERYGLKIFDIGEYLHHKINAQLKWDTHIPNNPEGGYVHFSKNEFAEIKKGDLVEVQIALPMLLHDSGIALMKRPPPPKEDQDIDDEEKAKREEEERKREEEEAKKKKKKKKPEEVTVDAPIVYDDLLLTELVPKPDENGKIPELKGYIFIDFPINEVQVATLKEQNIKLDRIIILKEDEEVEEPGAHFTKRPDFFKNTTFEDENAFVEA